MNVDLLFSINLLGVDSKSDARTEIHGHDPLPFPELKLTFHVFSDSFSTQVFGITNIGPICTAVSYKRHGE